MDVLENIAACRAQKEKWAERHAELDSLQTELIAQSCAVLARSRATLAQSRELLTNRPVDPDAGGAIIGPRYRTDDTTDG